jgi:hypothetical protein
VGVHGISLDMEEERSLEDVSRGMESRAIESDLMNRS